MTDHTINIAHDFHTAPVPEITAILDEGVLTVGSGFGVGGRDEIIAIPASQLYEGDWVALSNDTVATAELTGGLPVVEKAQDGESLTMFEIVTIDPAENRPSASSEADTLTKRITGKYYRKARVRVYGGVTAVVKAIVMCNGTNATVPGVGSTLKFNVTSAYAQAANSSKKKLVFDSVASGGVGVIPFHYVPAGSDGDLYSCVVGLTAQFASVTGA